MKRPETIEQYVEWAKETLFVDLEDVRNINLHNSNLSNALNSISQSPFINGLDAKLTMWSEEYDSLTNSQLFMDSSGLSLLKKPYKSAVDKSFRKNVLWNKKFPNKPDTGWATPENWFVLFDDMIRGTLVCKFIDGPSFVTAKLIEYAEEFGLSPTSRSQQRDEGYYAFQFFANFEVQLLNKAWESQATNTSLEIRITTQLQEVLNSLTHQYYQHSRIKPSNDRSKWKWEYNTNRFRAGYLCHTLHLLEAIIIDLRDSKIKGAADSIDEGEK